MNIYIFIAEDSRGNTITEGEVVANTLYFAWNLFWSNLTRAQKDACANIECIDVQAQTEPVFHLRQYGDVTKEELDRYIATGDINGKLV